MAQRYDDNPRCDHWSRVRTSPYAIAIEVERISEGQHFLTKLLGERDARPGMKAISPIPGVVRSPLPPTA